MADKSRRKNSVRSDKSSEHLPRWKRPSISVEEVRNGSLTGLTSPSKKEPPCPLFPSRSNGDVMGHRRNTLKLPHNSYLQQIDTSETIERITSKAGADVNNRNLLETSDSEIQELFQLMDVNKDQKLAPKELDCILRALGINATEADLIEFIGELPALEDGADKDCVTYEQFAESIKKNMALTSETDSLQVTFNAFDHAGDGFITSDKLKSVLSNLGLQFQDSDIQAIMQQVGSGGRISFDQFQQFMLNNDDVI